MMSKAKVIISIIFVLLLISGSLFAQSCLFVSAAEDPGRDSELPLIEQLGAWGYDIAIYSTAQITADPAFDFSVFDFCFASESVNSTALAFMKGHPIPFVSTEAWSTRPQALCWADPASAANNPLEPILIVDETGHQLAGGFASGDIVDLVDATDDEAAAVISCVPTIDFISIAVLSSDPERHVIMGVEAGTELTDGTIAENRGAIVGIHEMAYLYITDDAYNLIKAAINWVLNIPSAVETAKEGIPSQFELAQNYPNPFNPTTLISFSLPQNGYTTLKVYNTLGQEMRTLVNENLNAGYHQIQFDSQDLSSGIYFYHIKSGEFSQVNRMILMK